MNIEEIRAYVLTKPSVEECFPFGNETLVFKTKGKIFLLASLEAHPLKINLKCDPERAIELRERYACILPGYHMNKKHWNTIVLDGSLSNDQITGMIDHSYKLVSGIK